MFLYKNVLYPIAIRIGNFILKDSSELWVLLTAIQIALLPPPFLPQPFLNSIFLQFIEYGSKWLLATH